jgi:hypothetical protein
MKRSIAFLVNRLSESNKQEVYWFCAGSNPPAFLQTPSLVLGLAVILNSDGLIWNSILEFSQNLRQIDWKRILSSVLGPML